MIQTFDLPNEEATAEIGKVLAKAVKFKKGSLSTAILIGLLGPLGAGKTTLARILLRALGVAGTIRSPSYTLAEPYETRIGQVWHFDLYRLSDPDDLEYLGIRDLCTSSSLFLIEWPERGGGESIEFDLLINMGLSPEPEDSDPEDSESEKPESGNPKSGKPKSENEEPTPRRITFATGTRKGRTILGRVLKSLPVGWQPLQPASLS